MSCTSTVSDPLLPFDAFRMSMAPENACPTLTVVGHVGPTAPPIPANAGVASRNVRPQSAPIAAMRRRAETVGRDRIAPASAAKLQRCQSGARRAARIVLAYFIQAFPPV